MARQVDYHLKQQRDKFCAAMAISRSELSTLIERCRYLLAEAEHTIGSGNATGELLSRNLQTSLDVMLAGTSLLEQASQTASSIDVTVEVPDAGADNTGYRW